MIKRVLQVDSPPPLGVAALNTGTFRAVRAHGGHITYTKRHIVIWVLYGTYTTRTNAPMAKRVLQVESPPSLGVEDLNMGTFRTVRALGGHITYTTRHIVIWVLYGTYTTRTNAPMVKRVLQVDSPPPLGVAALNKCTFRDVRAPGGHITYTTRHIAIWVLYGTYTT
jgi:hypothetical protein